MKRSGSAAGSTAVKTEVKAEPGIKSETDDGNAAGPSNGGSLAARSAAAAAAKRETSPPPPTQFRDIPLLSSALDDWRYHLMRLASHAKVDPSDAQQFPFPVKLNRKWPPKPKEPLPHAGDPVVDQFGKPVMVPAQRRDPSQPQQQALTPAERKRIPLLWPGPDDDPQEVEELLSRLETPKGPQADASLIGPSASSNNATRAKAGLFQKRVREIYKASAAARKTHNEEAQPWILEDYETAKEWESRRKESRRGLKALQSAIKVRRDGGQFPSLPKAEESGDGAVKAEEDTKVNIASSNENHAPWIGKLEGEAHESGSTSAGGAMSHALFVFDERGMGAFRVVPVSRMYKFLQRPKHANKLNWEEAEKAFEHHQKARMGEGIGTWIKRNNEGNSSGGPSTAGRPGFRGYSGGGGDYGFGGYERYESKPIYRHLALPGMHNGGGGGGGGGGSGGYGRSPAPSVATIYDRDSSLRRNQFVAVSGESKRGIRVKDEEGTYGEIDFEEDFADDEERNEGDDYAMGEEETRELEQRIKREMARVEELAAEEEGDDDDLFGERGRPGRGENDMLTGSGKQMKKIMKALSRREGNDAYDDDDEDRNPYASDDESDEGEQSVMANPEEALRRVREEREREAKEAAKNQEKTGNTDGTSTAKDGSTAQSKEGSRSGTPAPARSAGGKQPQPQQQQQQQQQQQNSQPHRPGAGHANVAQRAASPHAHSRQGSRSGSPVRDGGTGAGTGTPSSSSLKRKSEASGGAGKRPRTGTGSNPTSPGSASPRSASPSRGSFRTASGGGGGASALQPLSELEREIVQLVRDGRAKTTKELISHFVARLNSKDASIKKGFSDAVTRVLMTKKPEGTLTVRSGFAE